MRITGGVHRSRPLVAPRGQATRPTSDRVREALFSALASHRSIVGTHVLDLYAGTGALGLEALSRGASSATWVERARDALVALEANLAALGVGERGRVLKCPVERGASLAAGSTFDVVFVDPPYRDVPSGALVRSLAPWIESGVFADDATLVVEHGARDEPPDLPTFTLVASKRYGDTALATYERTGHPLAT